MTDNSNISHDVFLSKNLYLESNETFEYLYLKPFEFFQLIFGSCDHRDPQCPIYPFEVEMCEEYKNWLAQQAGRKSKSKAGKKARYKAGQPFRYNALMQAIYDVEPDASRKNDSGRRSKTWVVVGDATSDEDIKVCGWDSLEELMGRYEFVVTTPATYVGRRRFKANARYLYAIAIDLDEVGVPELAEVIHQQMIGMTPKLISSLTRAMASTCITSSLSRCPYTPRCMRRSPTLKKLSHGSYGIKHPRGRGG